MSSQEKPGFGDASQHDKLRKRALSIFRYLRELELLKSTTVREFSSYERVFWFEVLHDKPGCTSRCFRADVDAPTSSRQINDDDVWLMVRKLTEPIAPIPSEQLRKWLTKDSWNNAESPPQLLDRISKPKSDAMELPRDSNDRSRSNDGAHGGPKGPALFDSEPTFESITDFPEVVDAFSVYIDRNWNPWATKHREWSAFQNDVYAPLFGIHRDLKRLGEEFELVLGVGCLSWIAPAGYRVRRHLISAQVDLEFDPANGVFTLGPGADGARLSLETDMLDPAQQPSMSQLNVIRDNLSQALDDPWDFDSIDRVLHGIARALDENGSYNGNAFAAAGVSDRPCIAFAPALMLRRRTSRGLLLAYDTVLEQIENGGEIPDGVRQLATSATDGNSINSPPSPSTVIETNQNKRVYFPCAANEEQLAIVERLDLKQGVLVQGPPGTGKTHTIANLICHLLASGKRVLITAQTPRALQVLRDKLPVSLRPLCLSVLGNDKASHDNIEESVKHITDRVDSWNAATLQDEISRTESELDRLLERETILERELRIFREAETHPHTVGNGTYKGTAQTIAAQLCRDRDQFAWFTDPISPEEQSPVSVDELHAYRARFAKITAARVAEIQRPRPVRDRDIPQGSELSNLVRGLKILTEKVQPPANSDGSLENLPTSDLRAAQSAMGTLQAAIQQISQVASPWAEAAKNEVLRGTDGNWQLISAHTREALAAIGIIDQEIIKSEVRLPTGRPMDVLQADAQDIVDHLARKGKLRVMWFFRPAVARRTMYLMKEAFVNGRACNTFESLRALKDHLECTARVEKTWALWNPHAKPNTPTLIQQITELRELADVLDRILALKALVSAAMAALLRLHLPNLPALHDASAILDLQQAIERILVRRTLSATKSRIETCSGALRALTHNPDAHTLCRTLAQALTNLDENALGDGLRELELLENDAIAYEEWELLHARLDAVLPSLAKAIATSYDDAAWEHRFAEFSNAWRWAQADAWLRKFTDSRKAHATESELSTVKQRTSQLLEHAAQGRAWNSCLASLSTAQQQHLSAWRQAIKKITKRGSGKRDPYFRRMAQVELEKCRESIPAWVMPLYRLLEVVRLGPAIFDIAIVDEASQCGPESLLLFYLAEKIIVVGDEKQISPSNVATDRDQARILLEQHLDGIELAHTFDVDSSLFDHGQIRLGRRITLREHFRCVPEIIRFSNDLCYNGTLVPLRQAPPNRLAPLVPRFLATGRREGGQNRAINHSESQAIVSTIAACCRDPMYAGKTMGVISLLGEHQAKCIERDLLNEIGAEEVDRRQIVCGDAYSFQGDERHVVFLSMVIAPKDRSEAGFAALTKTSDMQRFNVAASRAQDQLWLFHSVRPEDIGNIECMRYKLLNYFYDPARFAAEAIGIDLEDLRRRAESPDRPETAPPPFDSWFEIDVYLRLAGQGYRVLPQYKAGRHSIDLVLEGKSRLAIECDGDRWHGPERFDQDMARQRQLERAKWRFWRVRGSVFYRDPDAAMAPLWPLLSEMGIEPMAATDGTGVFDGYVPEIQNEHAEGSTEI